MRSWIGVLPEVKQRVRETLGLPLRRKLESDDVVQDAIVALLERVKLHDVNDEEHLRNLLTRLVRNAICAKYHYFSAERRAFLKERALQNSHATEALKSFVNRVATPSDILTVKEQFDQTLLDIMLMDSKYQDVLVMRIDDFPYAQIAKKLEISEASARKRYTRALTKLLIARTQLA